MFLVNILQADHAGKLTACNHRYNQERLGIFANQYFTIILFCKLQKVLVNENTLLCINYVFSKALWLPGSQQRPVALFISITIFNKSCLFIVGYYIDYLC